MKKITELVETKYRTVHYKDEYGNRQKGQEEYLGKRMIKSVADGPRVGHFLVDLVAFQILMTVADYLLELISHLANFSTVLSLTTGLLVALCAILLYPALYIFCEYKWQKTPGKFLTKTVVIDEYGNRPDLGTLILRNILREVPFEPISCFGKYSHGWHDKWSKTWVVPEEELATLKRLQIEQANDLSE